MAGNLARRLAAVERRVHGAQSRTLLMVIEPDESDADAEERLERIHGTIKCCLAECAVDLLPDRPLAGRRSRRA